MLPKTVMDTSPPDILDTLIALELGQAKIDRLVAAGEIATSAVELTMAQSTNSD